MLNSQCSQAPARDTLHFYDRFVQG